MRLLQRCQSLLRGAYLAAEQGNAFSPSGIRCWETTVRLLGRPTGVADGLASLEPGQLRHASQSSIAMHGTTTNSLKQQTAWPWLLSQTRGLFGAAKAPSNPQVHTHENYKKEYPQPAYEFLNGRFVLDRNGTIWHRQANYRHKRYAKSASQLTRLKRWKPLYAAYANKLKRLGFSNRYWAPPNPQEVPGWHETPEGRAQFKVLRRRSAVPALDHTTGEPALRQRWVPPPRQSIR